VNLFLSYHFGRDELLVKAIYYFLNKQLGLKTFYWSNDGRANPVFTQLDDELRESFLVAMLGSTVGTTQVQEITAHYEFHKGRRRLKVLLGGFQPEGVGTLLAGAPEVTAQLNPDLSDFSERAMLCARDIVRCLGVDWTPPDGLPDSYLFEREKDIIQKYAEGQGQISAELVGKGCSRKWPLVNKKPAELDNPVSPELIGIYRNDTDQIVVDTRTTILQKAISLTLPEAGPRLKLRFPLRHRADLRIGILVSGGIAPGINAIVDGIVGRHLLYQRESIRRTYSLHVKGFLQGFDGVLEGGINHAFSLTANPGYNIEEDYNNILGIPNLKSKAESGGSILGTSRADGLIGEHRTKLLRNVALRLSEAVDILYVIGGDGSMRAAHAIWTIAQEENKELSVVCIPKTMDNDILWVWQSFGFLSAVEKAREHIMNLHSEVTSNPRVGVIQLFGSDSGFVASHAAYSSICDIVLIPEDPLSMNQIFEGYLRSKLQERYNKGQPHALIVMAETALPTDAGNYLNDDYNDDIGLSDDEKRSVSCFIQGQRRVGGQTPDELRTAGLKIVAGVLQSKIRNDDNLQPRAYWEKFRVLKNEPRHLIRSIRPSVSDVIFAERLGALAVDNAMGGYSDFMVSHWLTEFVLVPLQLVVLGRKRVSTNGIFWKSVLARTGQPSNTLTTQRQGL
jgi:6-phosphofructokinase 1